MTSEYNPAEQQTEQKYHAAGVGEIAEPVVKGHDEKFKLAAFKRGGGRCARPEVLTRPRIVSS